MSRQRNRSAFRVLSSAFRLVAWAREVVPLYRELYAGLPPVTSARDFRRLPVLTAARLRATPLADQVDDLRDVLRTFTPYQLQTAVPPAAIVADRDDTDAAFDDCREAFALAGIRAGARVVVLAPPEQRYFAAELAERLGYFDVQAHVLVHHAGGTTAGLLDALAPEHVIVAGCPPPAFEPVVTIRAATGHDGSGSSIARSALPIAHCPLPVAPPADLYVVPEAGFVGVRPPGEPSYVPLRDRYLIEAEDDGRLLLTALYRYHQPLIRYELPDRGRIEGGRLWLDEVIP